MVELLIKFEKDFISVHFELIFPMLEQKKNIFFKIQLCHAQFPMERQHHHNAKFLKKLISKFQENTQTYRKTKGWKDGQNVSWDSAGYRRMSNKSIIY